MKILYNPDGSVNKVELSNYVNQNNNNVDKIFVAIIGKEPSEYNCTAYFTLPTGDVNFLTVTQTDTFTIGDDPTEYSGKWFYLTNQQTAYAGVLSMSIEFTTVGGSSQHLFTYNCKITINPTNVLPSDTDITLDEYQRIVEALAGKIETNASRISAVDSGITAAKVETYDAAVTSLTEHEANTTIHVTAEDKTTWNGHVANTQIHVTPEEKSYWNGKSIVTVDNQSPSTSVPVISYITINGNTYQILAASPGTTVAWGNISGNIADQLDLKTILDGKAEKTAIPNLQTTTTVIQDALTNINGRVLSSYEATYYSAEQSSTGYAYYNITKSTVNLTEVEAKDYMEYMTGSRFLPTYDYEKPVNSLFIMADGSFWKPQYDILNGFRLYQIPNPYVTSIKTFQGESMLGSGDLNPTWGKINGTLSNQTDLQNALDAKQPTLVSGTNIKTVNGQSVVGSGNVSVGKTTLYKHSFLSTGSEQIVMITNSDESVVSASGFVTAFGNCVSCKIEDTAAVTDRVAVCKVIAVYLGTPTSSAVLKYINASSGAIKTYTLSSFNDTVTQY